MALCDQDCVSIYQILTFHSERKPLRDRPEHVPPSPVANRSRFVLVGQMGSKTFRSLYDFVRHGTNVHVSCRNGHCENGGIVDAYSVSTWFRLHRWPDSLEWLASGGAADHFRCRRCGSKGGSLRPTMDAPTVLNFFPVDDNGWKALQRRLRG